VGRYVAHFRNKNTRCDIWLSTLEIRNEFTYRVRTLKEAPYYGSTGFLGYVLICLQSEETKGSMLSIWP
jgi:hypothetical protein